MKNDLLFYEKKINAKLLAGIDEAGRGPLYGEVVAAAVILNKTMDISGINDSKKLSAKKREIMYNVITKYCQYGVGIASASEIDQINILEATKLAARRALLDLANRFDGIMPDFLLTDALELSDINIDQQKLIKGDTLSASIAAASIVAKVTRDRLMVADSMIYPNYGLDRHKGYGTKLHYEAIKKYGILPKHRMSFLKNLGEK